MYCYSSLTGEAVHVFPFSMAVVALLSSSSFTKKLLTPTVGVGFHCHSMVNDCISSAPHETKVQGLGQDSGDELTEGVLKVSHTLP